MRVTVQDLLVRHTAVPCEAVHPGRGEAARLRHVFAGGVDQLRLPLQTGGRNDLPAARPPPNFGHAPG
jgi:hypothetical protein